MTATTPELPSLLERLGKGRDSFAARPVKVPTALANAGVMLWRAAWSYTGYTNGLAAITTRTEGSWYVWLAGEFLGQCASKASALDLAQTGVDIVMADRPTGPNNLDDYDVVLVNSSAGKDSQAMLTRIVELADDAGYPRDQIVVVHCDLGRVEWAGTRELAERQAAAYGLRFEVVAREQDLLDQIEARGMFPSSAARYCTSDQKSAQVKKLITRLTAELAHLGRPVRILNCLGIRADESPARAQKAPFEVESVNGKRTVDRWLPIFDWTTERVWDVIRASGLPWHPAYDAGMPRLSCVFCVLAGERELVLAARLNPALAAEYVAVEERIGHTFKAKRSIAGIRDEARRLDAAGAPIVPVAGELAACGA